MFFCFLLLLFSLQLLDWIIIIIIKFVTTIWTGRDCYWVVTAFSFSSTLKMMITCWLVMVLKKMHFLHNWIVLQTLPHLFSRLLYTFLLSLFYGLCLHFVSFIVVMDKHLGKCRRVFNWKTFKLIELDS